MLVTSISSFSPQYFQVYERWKLSVLAMHNLSSENALNLVLSKAFSSFEYNILNGNFNGGPVSIRCHQSCVVNNFFKHFLLPNHWADLDQTWQECSLGNPLQKVFTEFDSIKNSDCHGNQMDFLSKSLKIFSGTVGQILK